MPGEAKRSDTGCRSIELNAEQEVWLGEYFPTTPNCILMEKSGLSHSSMHRLARKYGLTKDAAIRTELLQWTYIHKTKAKCIETGVYERFRQNARPEALIAWRKTANAQGWSSIKSLREKSPRRYRKMMVQRSEARKDAIRRDRLRQKYGMERKTNLHIPENPFTRKQTCFRYNMKKKGYILGDMREEMGERFTINFDDQTERSQIMEGHAKEQGFKVTRLTD